MLYDYAFLKNVFFDLCTKELRIMRNQLIKTFGILVLIFSTPCFGVGYNQCQLVEILSNGKTQNIDLSQQVDDGQYYHQTYVNGRQIGITSACYSPSCSSPTRLDFFIQIDIDGKKHISSGIKNPYKDASLTISFTIEDNEYSVSCKNPTK